MMCDKFDGHIYSLTNTNRLVSTAQEHSLDQSDCIWKGRQVADPKGFATNRSCPSTLLYFAYACVRNFTCR